MAHRQLPYGLPDGMAGSKGTATRPFSPAGKHLLPVTCQLILSGAPPVLVGHMYITVGEGHGFRGKAP